MRSLLTTPLGWAFLLGIAWLVLRFVPLKRDGERRRGVPGAGVLLVAAWLVPLLSGTPLVAQMVSGPLLARVASLPEPAWSATSPPEAIVVLGGGLNGPRLPGAVLGRETGRRLREGVAASQRWPDARLVFSGGGAMPGDVSSATRMAEEALALGVDPSRIVTEERAGTTRGNAVHVAAWMHDAGVTRIALVTSAIHMPRSHAAFRREGVEAWALPAGAPPGRTPLSEALWLDASSFVDTTLAIHEHIGLVYYRARGWIEGDRRSR